MNPLSPTHLKEKYSVVSMKLYRCLYSILSKCQFFCGVIWILTNSFMCRKRVQVDEQIWTFLKAKDKRAASHCTKTKHQVWSYSIYFYNVWRVGSCDVKKKNEKKEKKKQRNKTESCCHFSLALWDRGQNPVMMMMMHSLVSSLSLSPGQKENPVQVGITHASSRRTACACIEV